jgi:hypothetical protein
VFFQVQPGTFCCKYPALRGQWRSKTLQDLLLNLRININSQTSTKLNSITVAALVEHYRNTELAEPEDEESGKAYSTRSRLNWLLNRWVLPRWGKENIGDVKTVAVENWLKTLSRAKKRVQNKQGQAKQDGPKTRLARGTRAKIRNAMSALYNHAIRWEFTDKNPITGPVKGSRRACKREANVDSRHPHR